MQALQRGVVTGVTVGHKPLALRQIVGLCRGMGAGWGPVCPTGVHSVALP